MYVKINIIIIIIIIITQAEFFFWRAIFNDKNVTSQSSFHLSNLSITSNHLFEQKTKKFNRKRKQTWSISKLFIICHFYNPRKVKHKKYTKTSQWFSCQRLCTLLYMNWTSVCSPRWFDYKHQSCNKTIIKPVMDTLNWQFLIKLQSHTSEATTNGHTEHMNYTHTSHHYHYICI